MSAFEELGVLPEIIRAIEEQDWFLPTPIQTEAIPLILGGGDVLASAETGSGKTGAFALPIVQVVWEELRDISRGKASVGGARSQVAQLSPDDRDPALQLVDGTGGLDAVSATGTWAGARATVGVVGGMHSFEVTVAELGDGGLARVGWSAPGARLDLGTDRGGFGFGATAKKSNMRQFVEYGVTFGAGDVIGAHFDAGSGSLSFSKNGVWLGEAFAVPADVSRSGMFPAICLKSARVAVNLGGSPFRFAPPRGFSAIVGAPAGHVIEPPAGGGQAGPQPPSHGAAGPLCIVLEPTRELAEQTHSAFESFTKYLAAPALRFALLVGGLPPGPQQAALRKGAEVVTATPGRLEAFVSDGSLSLSNVRFLVLDEGDNLAANNPDTIRAVYSKVPKSRLQVLMFSATLHSDQIRSLADQICRFPTWVDLKGKDAVPLTVDHAFCWVDPERPVPSPLTTLQVTTDGVHCGQRNSPAEAVSEAIKVQKAQVLLKVIEAHKMSQAIIFCRTKIDCDNLESFLNAVGGGGGGGGRARGIGALEHPYSCTVVHADRVQQERQANLERFKEGEARFLITTDVGSRGIDISEVPFVINYTLPDKPEDYIHRVGRVGRADRMGLAISLVGKLQEKVWYHRCPSRGKSCQNRALLEQGGCTIWYNEPEFWAAIQARLGQTQAIHLDANYRDTRFSTTSQVQYGQRRSEKSDVLSHAGELKDRVLELAALEDTAQLNYWALRTQGAKQKSPQKDSAMEKR